MNSRKGFTLIEILIVVAIIAILASVVLVGLGPTQSAGRDARRVADLHESQNGLELYYNQNGKYPDAKSQSWVNIGTTLEAANIGINSWPNDPSSGKNYFYGTTATDNGYIVGANMENSTGGEWNNYVAPSNFGTIANWTVTPSACTLAKLEYCQTL